MKLRRVILCFGLFSLAFAAQDRRIPSPDRLESATIRPIIDLNGTVVSFIVTARFVTIDSRPDGTVTTTSLGSVELDLMKSNGTVVIDSVSVDDNEAADHLLAILTREWRRANPSALPQRRRAMRQP